MPVVYVGESHATGKRRVLQLVFPRLIDEALPEHKRWAWDELRVGVRRSLLGTLLIFVGT